MKKSIFFSRGACWLVGFVILASGFYIANFKINFFRQLDIINQGYFVMDVNPQDGAREVDSRENVVIRFSSLLDKNTINSDHIKIKYQDDPSRCCEINDLEVVFRYDPESYLLEIDPVLPWEAGRTVIVEITDGLKNIDGNLLVRNVADKNSTGRYKFSFIAY